MKKSILPVCVICVVMLASFSCTKDEFYELPKPVHTLKPEAALERGTFQLVKDSSWLIISLMKNHKIPVKASLYFNSGVIDLQKGKATAQLDVDLLSWDSGLNERDQMVQKIIFKQTLQAPHLVLVDMIQETEGLLDKFKQTKKISEVPLKGVLTFINAKIPVETVANIYFNERDRLVVETKPVTLTFAELGLTEAVQNLVELAELESLSEGIEITANLEFAAF